MMKSGARGITPAAVDSIVVSPVLGVVRNQPAMFAPAIVVAVVVNVTNISLQIDCPVMLLVKTLALVAVPLDARETASVDISVSEGERIPLKLDPACQRKFLALESVTVPEDSAMALESPTVVLPLPAEAPSVESATTRAAMVEVTALDPATTFARFTEELIVTGMPPAAKVWSLASVTGAELALVVWPFALMPFGDIATRSAGMLDVGSDESPVTTATLEPKMIVVAPDETDAIVGLDDRITVGFEESVTVRAEEFGDSVVTKALIVEVTALAAPVIATVTGADVLPFEIGAPTCVR